MGSARVPESRMIPLRCGNLTSQVRHDMGWEPAEPTEVRKSLEPAKALKPYKPAEAPPVPSAAAACPNVTTINKNPELPNASNSGVSIL